MSKTQKNPRISRAVRKGVFGQRGQQPRVGLYARVSTHDQQTLPMQLSAMRGYAKKRKWIVAVEVKDVGSGATTRPKREELIDAARRREIDAVLVWRLDRWGRSLVDLVSTLQELTALEVGFVSLSEALDLTTPSGRALAGMLAVFADYAERAIMRSHGAEAVVWPALQGFGAPHNSGSTEEGIGRRSMDTSANLEDAGTALPSPTARAALCATWGSVYRWARQRPVLCGVLSH